MTSSAAPERAPVADRRLCPNCGRVNEGQRRVCSFCFGSLRDAREAPPAGPRSYRGLAIRLLLAVTLVGAVGGVLYRDYQQDRALPPQPVSTARTMIADVGQGRAVDVSPTLDGAIAWRQPLPSPASTTPALDDARAYVPVTDGRLLAVSLEDGRTVWSVVVAGQLDGTPTVAGDLVYVATRNGYVFAFEAADGRTRWVTELHASAFSSPAVVGGVVYVAAGRNLVALDAETGKELWRYVVDHDVVAAPAVTETSVGVVTTRELFIIDRTTGRETYHLTVGFLRGVAARQDVMIARSTRLTVAVDEDSYRPWWEPIRGAWFNLYLMDLAPAVPPPPNRWVVRGEADRPLRAGLRAVWPEPNPLVVDGERAYLSLLRGELQAVDLESGEVLWEITTKPMGAPPISTPDGLLVTEEHALVLLDPETGIERSRRDFADVQLDEIAVGRNVLLLATPDELQLFRR